MAKSYEERMRENGYTDDMFHIEDIMREAGIKRRHVKIVDINDIVYEGKADGYAKADDEEDGFATICIDTEDKGGWRLGVNEIKSIEILE